MIVLTTGNSLLSLLPSNVLLSDAQELGEYSLFGAENTEKVLCLYCYDINVDIY